MRMGCLLNRHVTATLDLRAKYPVTFLACVGARFGVGRAVVRGRGRGAGRTDSFRVLAMIASMCAGCARAVALWPPRRKQTPFFRRP